MCARFTLFVEPKAVADFFQTPEPTFDWEPRYNIAPTQSVVACRSTTDASGRELIKLRWGLIPSWAKDLAEGVKALNARAETIAEKPTFRTAFRKRRCLIPASGFYEWKILGKAKQPYFIHPQEGKLFAFAGLWESWPQGAEPVESCTIITTSANETMQHYHERMPVIVSPAGFAAWLDPTTEPAALFDMLRPCPVDRLDVYPVDVRVGNVRNQGHELIAPLQG